MILKFKTDGFINFGRQKLSFQPWDVTIVPALFADWPIIIKYLEQYKVVLGEWGLAPDHFSPHEDLMDARKSGIGFEIDINLINKLDRCIVPTDSGFMPAVTTKWIDTINSDIVSTFAVCTTDGHPIILDEHSAIDWLNKSPA